MVDFQPTFGDPLLLIWVYLNRKILLESKLLCKSVNWKILLIIFYLAPIKSAIISILQLRSHYYISSATLTQHIIANSAQQGECMYSWPIEEHLHLFICTVVLQYFSIQVFYHFQTREILEISIVEIIKNKQNYSDLLKYNLLMHG